MIKSDINLLPKKKKLPMSVSFGIPLGIIILVVLVAIGVILPNILLDMKQKKLASLEEELASYSDTESDYTKKIALFTTLQNQKLTYNDFIGSNK